MRSKGSWRRLSKSSSVKRSPKLVQEVRPLFLVQKRIDSSACRGLTGRHQDQGVIVSQDALSARAEGSMSAPVRKHISCAALNNISRCGLGRSRKSLGVQTLAGVRWRIRSRTRALRASARPRRACLSCLIFVCILRTDFMSSLIRPKNIYDFRTNQAYQGFLSNVLSEWASRRWL
jgi:hypothetical protein